MSEGLTACMCTLMPREIVLFLDMEWGPLGLKVHSSTVLKGGRAVSLCGGWLLCPPFFWPISPITRPRDGLSAISDHFFLGYLPSNTLGGDYFQWGNYFWVTSCTVRSPGPELDIVQFLWFQTTSCTDIYICPHLHPAFGYLKRVIVTPNFYPHFTFLF